MEAIAVVGPSGAGKTTLLEVIPGLVEPDAVQVVVQGVALTRDLGPWQRRHVGYVPQDAVRLDDTVAAISPIVAQTSAVSPDRVWRSLAAAQLAEFMAAAVLLGLDTPVGNRGAVPSRGQWQAIGRARAFHRSPTC